MLLAPVYGMANRSKPVIHGNVEPETTVCVGFSDTGCKMSQWDTYLRQDSLHQQNVTMLQLCLVECLLPMQLLYHHLGIKLDLLSHLHIPQATLLKGP